MTRVMLSLVPVPLVLVMAACSDGLTGPGRAARVDVISGDAQSGIAGNSLEERLVVVALDERNRPLPNTIVTWRVRSGGGSIAPARSRTDAGGIARVTWTLGIDSGRQEAAASAGYARPVFLSASAAPIGDTCDGSPLDLPMGGSLTFSPAQLTELCLESTPLFTRDFVLMAFNRSRSELSDVAVEVEGTNIVTAANPPSPSFDAALRSGFSSRPLRRNQTFDVRLRQMERAELAPRVSAVAQSRLQLDVSASSQFAAPAVGDMVTLNTNATNACALAKQQSGRVAALSQRAIVVEDLANPGGGFTPEEYGEIAQAYDDLVWPVDVSNFGEPSDIDANGRTVLFYTVEVNKLTPPGAPDGFVAGFFFARDLFPRTGGGRLSGCATSNEAEMMYLMVPDPLGTINGNQRDKDFVRERTIATVAHELEHLINASRRLYVNDGALYPERAWLDEGLAHAAEELVFFEASGLGPGQNITGLVLNENETRREAFNLFQAENVARMEFFLKETNTNWLFRNGAAPDVATRGAAAWFLRYAVDRMQTPDGAAWHALVNSPDTGLRNLEGVIGADAVLWMRDWSAALYVDDVIHDLALKHQVPSWYLRSVLLSLDDESTYPIRPTPLMPGVAAEADLESGGSVFFRFGVAPSIPGRLRVSAGGEDGDQLSMVLIRTR